MSEVEAMSASTGVFGKIHIAGCRLDSDIENMPMLPSMATGHQMNPMNRGRYVWVQSRT